VVCFAVVARFTRWEDVAHDVRAAFADWDEVFYMKIFMFSTISTRVIKAGEAIFDLLRGHLKQMAAFHGCFASLAFFPMINTQQWLG
jgi:hypothetical protein